MIEFTLLIGALVIIVWFAGAVIGGLAFAVPIIVIWLIGNALGLSWWQSLLIAFVIAGLIMQIVEKNRVRRFKQHAHSFGLSPGDLGRQVEIEGKLHTIKGLAGDKIVVERRLGEWAKKVDPRLIAQKLKP